MGAQPPTLFFKTETFNTKTDSICDALHLILKPIHLKFVPEYKLFKSRVWNVVSTGKMDI